MAAVTAAVVATSAPAHADVTVMRAGLACGYNRVYAYAPSPDYTRSTLAGVELDTRAELYRWDRYSSTWQRVAQSGWWAYTITDYAGRPGTPVPNAHWATYGNRGTSYYQFAATPGYAYAVKSYVYDRGRPHDPLHLELHQREQHGVQQVVLDRLTPAGGGYAGWVPPGIPAFVSPSGPAVQQPPWLA